MPMLPSYRNQSINLHSKSIDWFLYEGNTDIEWVKEKRSWNRKNDIKVYLNKCHILLSW